LDAWRSRLSGRAVAVAAGHAAITALAVIRGCRLVRTDAVHAAVRVARVTAAILEAR
jgi:dihydropteroate synthase